MSTHNICFNEAVETRSNLDGTSNSTAETDRTEIIVESIHTQPDRQLVHALGLIPSRLDL